MKIAEDFKKEAIENTKLSIPADLASNGSSLTVGYDINTIEPKQLVSLRYYADSFYAGSAHPSHKFSTLNYDLVHGQVLQLSDLFTAYSQYLQLLASAAKQKIITQLKKASAGYETSIFNEGFSPTVENYKVWNITPRGLKKTFNEYQVVAYALGPQFAFIPYADLKKILNKQSVLAQCLDNPQCKIISDKNIK